MQKIKYLPLEEAVIEAAWQNFSHDVNNELVEYDSWEEDKQLYMAEAREILVTTGTNYIPEDDEPLIALDTFNAE